jgi:enamine deaminase RidA (YjgF/YER057c/UK114 family)
MRKTFDNPSSVPAPAGAYSHVARLEHDSGALLVISGQVAIGADGELVGEGDMTAQSERVFDSLAAILAAHGATLADVINIRTYVTDMELIREYALVRRRYLTGDPPTSTTVEVSRLVMPGALVEVEVMAAVGG